MVFKQPDLPYDLNALSPLISEETMDYHYNKHHATYFKNLNKLVEGKPESEQSLENVVLNSTGGIFNNAAQAWNHIFFWDCMFPKGKGKPQGELLSAIEQQFNSLDGFKQKFTQSALALFGSGWVWLVSDQSGKLDIMALSNAENPLKSKKTPILGLDVWEHAYYIDYRNDRAKYIAQFFGLVNWDFVDQCYKSAS